MVYRVFLTRRLAYIYIFLFFSNFWWKKQLTFLTTPLIVCSHVPSKRSLTTTLFSHFVKRFLCVFLGQICNVGGSPFKPSKVPTERIVLIYVVRRLRCISCCFPVSTKNDEKSDTSVPGP